MNAIVSRRVVSPEGAAIWAEELTIAPEVLAAMRRHFSDGTTCEKCGGASTERPSGDRVCVACGYTWTVGEIKREVPKP